MPLLSPLVLALEHPGLVHHQLEGRLSERLSGYLQVVMDRGVVLIYIREFNDLFVDDDSYFLSRCCEDISF
jgi:hypothetical protein